MLIQFSVANFRSFKEMQTLSLVKEDSFPGLDENSSSLKSADGNISLLKTVAIYGPNASGKSTLVDALGYMRSFILGSVKNQRGDEIEWVSPFLLDSVTSKQPSVFEIQFVLENAEGKNIAYQYGFALTKERIYEEWLYERSLSKNVLFTRSYDPSSKETEWDCRDCLKAGDIHHRTLENTLFLSKLIQENNQELVPVFDWFHKTLNVYSSRRSERTIINKIIKSEFNKRKDKILHFLKDADVGISDLQVSQKQIDIDESAFPKSFTSTEINEIKSQLSTKLLSIHTRKDDQAKIEFNFLEDESDGTVAMFVLASILIEAVDSKKVYLMDELDKSMHPLLMRNFIRAFHAFVKHSQLVFTAHDVTQIDEEVFRRDQIGFLEKDFSTEASSIFKLSDVQEIEKTDSRWARKYVLGAYGALPNTGNFDLR